VRFELQVTRGDRIVTVGRGTATGARVVRLSWNPVVTSKVLVRMHVPKRGAELAELVVRR
jgi:hypothetical protein